MGVRGAIVALGKRVAVVRARFATRVTLGVRGAVFDEGGRVLLVKHTYVAGWYFPGGGIEGHETAGEAFAREVAEETGVGLAGPPRLASLHLNPRVGPRDHVAFFVATAVAGARPVAAVGEIAEVGFFSPDRLPEGVTGATRRRIGEVVAGAPIDRAW